MQRHRARLTESHAKPALLQPVQRDVYHPKTGGDIDEWVHQMDKDEREEWGSIVKEMKVSTLKWARRAMPWLL